MITDVKCQVIESYTASKSGRLEENEDGIYTSDSFFAVIDGATSKTDRRLDGQTPGQVIRNIILENLPRLDTSCSCDEAIAFLQNQICSDYRAQYFPTLSASAIIFSLHRQEIWSIGDCQARVDGRLIQEKKVVDQLLSEARSLAIHAFIASGSTEEEISMNDKGRELILPFLKLQYLFENKQGKYGYCVFNNSSSPNSIISLARVFDVHGCNELVLASDGYPEAKSSLAESEEYLQKTISQDRLCYKSFPSTKGLQKGNTSFDDRSYLRLSLK